MYIKLETKSRTNGKKYLKLVYANIIIMIIIIIIIIIIIKS